MLKGHTNFVKGVTWDPVGSYLASQSTDNTVRVWNTVDWTMETIIEGPFSNSSNNGHVMRATNARQLLDFSTKLDVNLLDQVFTL